MAAMPGTGPKSGRAGLKRRRRCARSSPGPATTRRARASPIRLPAWRKSYEEFFAGYEGDPYDILSRTFEDVQGYDDFVMLRDIRVESHCEHHMLPIIGVAHIAYMPRDRIVGISKLARVADIYAKRLQTQETMTAQIATAIEEVLQPLGVAVMIDALHECMTTRGVHKSGTTTITTRFTGVFKDDPSYRDRFIQLVNGLRPVTVK